MEQQLNDTYWSTRYQKQQTGWDIGGPSQPLKEYIQQYTNKEARILIPGCGNAYEAKLLIEEGFQNITLIDISKVLVEELQEQLAAFYNQVQIIHGDFFDHSGEYDLIIEQTFFCAIDPVFREKYAQKMHELLAVNGKLVGVLFNRYFEGGPPFGGTKEEYISTFSHQFEIKKMETCYNSIKPRENTELFINLSPKK
jgi:SAM-dependent methyltransferase